MRNGPYELITAPEGYPGFRYRGRYCYEHIAVWWKTHGVVPSKGLEIHHVNGDHRDNRISNLRLVTSTEHRRIHGEISHAKTTVTLKCAQCAKVFKRRGAQYRSAAKKNKTAAMFCSSQCQHKSMVRSTRVGSRERTVNASRKPSLVRVQPPQPKNQWNGPAI